MSGTRTHTMFRGLALLVLGAAMVLSLLVRWVGGSGAEPVDQLGGIEVVSPVDDSETIPPPAKGPAVEGVSLELSKTLDFEVTEATAAASSSGSTAAGPRSGRVVSVGAV